MEILFFAKYYLFFITTTILLYCVGRAFVATFLQDILLLPKYYQTFLILVLGTVISVTLFSIWKTNGITINLIFIAVIFILIKEKNEFKPHIRDQQFAPIKFQDFLIALSTSLIIFIYNCSNIKNDQLISDHIFYSRVSYFLPYTGQENEFYISNFLAKEFEGTTPYHYFELWLNSLITYVFGDLSINNFILLTGTILVNMVVVGYIALWERFKNISYTIPFLSLVLLLYGGIQSPIFKNIPLLKEYQYIGFSLLSNNISKYSIVYIFVLVSLLSLLYQQRKVSIIFLLFLPVATFTAIPAVGGGLILFIIINLCLNRCYRKEAVILFIYLTVTIGLIFLFYSLSANHIINEDRSLSDIGSYFKSFDVRGLKTRFNIFAGAVISALTLYLPLWLCLGFIYYRRYTVVGYDIFLRQVVCLLFAGLLSWCFLADALDSVQVFSFIVKSLNVLFAISTIIIISNLSKVGNLKFGIYNVAIIISLIFIPIDQLIFRVKSVKVDRQRYSSSYLKKIKGFIENSKSLTGVFIKNNTDYPDIYSKSPTFSVLGDYLPAMDDHAIAVSISEYSIPFNTASPLEDERAMKSVRKGVFYQFVEKEKKANVFTSIENSQLNFIKNFEIKYVIVAPLAQISPAINALVSTEFVDEKTGEKFLILNNK